MSVVARGIGIVEAWITVLDGKLASYDESILSYDSEEDLDEQDHCETQGVGKIYL